MGLILSMLAGLIRGVIDPFLLSELIHRQREKEREREKLNLAWINVQLLILSKLTELVCAMIDPFHIDPA